MYTTSKTLPLLPVKASLVFYSHPLPFLRPKRLLRSLPFLLPPTPLGGTPTPTPNPKPERTIIIIDCLALLSRAHRTCQTPREREREQKMFRERGNWSVTTMTMAIIIAKVFYVSFSLLISIHPLSPSSLSISLLTSQRGWKKKALDIRHFVVELKKCTVYMCVSCV